MSKHRKIIIALVSTITLAVAAAGYAHNRTNHNPESHANAVVKEITSELNLSVDQQNKLGSLKTQFLTLHQQLHQEKSNMHQSLMSLINSTSLDQTHALSIINHSTQIVNDNATSIISSLGEFYDSLDTEQQAKIREKMEHRMGKHHNSMHQDHYNHGG